MRANPIKARGRYIPVKSRNFFWKRQFLIVFLNFQETIYPEQLTGAASKIQLKSFNHL